MDYVDSNKRKLNSGQIIAIFLENTDQQHPPQVIMPAILTELSHPNVKTKQIGNTLFEVITGHGDQAFFKSFNADTGPNFVNNSKMFCIWARKILGLKVLVTEFHDSALLQLFKIISLKPPLPNMGYKAYNTTNGGFRIVLNLGD